MSSPIIRIGNGYDVHQLVSGRKLILGGVNVPHSKGLDGHSDADALLHALCDALLGAVGAGDIGAYFPDSDPKWKGISSIVLLEQVTAICRGKGYEIAVQAFLEELIPYKDIAELIRMVMQNHNPSPLKELQDVLIADRWAREETTKLVTVTY